MDNIKLNNQIISMRKFVKQGKVRLINKLVKDAKRLQVKHGSDLQMQKYKRKSKKLLSEVQILKTLNVDCVSKAALAKERNWTDVLTSKSATPEARALALLANYDAVQLQVESFLTDNPNIVSRIPDLIKHWEEKKSLKPEKNPKTVRASIIRQNKKERISKRSNGVTNKQRFGLAASIGGQNDDRFKFNKRMQNTDESEKGDSKLLDSHSSEQQNRRFVADYNSADMKSMEINEDEKSNLKALPPRKLVIRTKTEKQVALLKLDDLNEADTIPFDRVSESEEACSDAEKDGSDDEQDKQMDLKNDPFFISGDEPVVEEERQSEESMSESDNESTKKRNDRRFQNERKLGIKFVKRNFQPDSRKDFRSNHMQQRNGHQFPQRHSAPNKNFGNKRFAQHGQGQRQSFPKRDFKDKSSFMQKGPPYRRQDSSRKDFKPTYQSNDRMLPSKGKNNEFRNPKGAKPQRTLLSGATSSSLHPSWEAKKKLKEKEFKIAPFRGTKIKFQD